MALVGIVEGLPAGLIVEEQQINCMLRRRKKGYGRGGRMKIEADEVKILSGVYKGETLGSPMAMYIENKDWVNWRNEERPKMSVPRPGHADLAGAIKYDFDDLQRVSERASARETAMRTAIGGVAKILLAEFDLGVSAHVTRIGKVALEGRDICPAEIGQKTEESPVSCVDKKTSEAMCKQIDLAESKGETLGGVFEVVVEGVPAGLGSYVHWDRRLDGRLARAVLSIPSVKGVEIGEAIDNSQKYGSEVHDQIFITKGNIQRKTNRAGGIEGGVTNGEQLLVRGFVKPIPTLGNPLASVDLQSRRNSKAPIVRSDICVVPAVSVIAEAVVAWEMACAFAEKFGGDSLKEMKENYQAYRKRNSR